jgi:hypothetical protein
MLDELRTELQRRRAARGEPPVVVVTSGYDDDARNAGATDEALVIVTGVPRAEGDIQCSDDPIPEPDNPVTSLPVFQDFAVPHCGETLMVIARRR